MSEAARESAFAAFCVFALVIAVVGLFAMSQVVAARRRHEIGVRKTLGAATAQIVFMLLRSFSLPVSRPDETASRTAFSISRCEVTPTFLRNLRTLVFRASSFMIISSMACTGWPAVEA